MPTMLWGVGASARPAVDEGTVYALFTLYAGMGYTNAFLETVGGLPGQSAPAAFNFGRGYGVLRMALVAAGISIHPAQPATWKAKMGVASWRPRSKPDTTPLDLDNPKSPRQVKQALKADSRRRASELLPSHAHLWPLVKHDGRAEAALLCLYGERVLRGRD